MSQIRRAHSSAADARTAVRELHQGLVQADTELVLFFCSSAYKLDELADEINGLFGNITVVGCTTAGEIGPLGYRDSSLSGVSFPADTCTAVTAALDDLKDFSIAHGKGVAQSLLQRLEQRTPGAGFGNTFGFLLIDGLSIREEPVTRTLQAALGDIPLFGGSAGDDLKFERTWVFHEGRFRTDSAVLVLISTNLPFRTFKTQHFVSLDERLVVTEADADRRVVREINGLPAAEEYARLIGVNPDQLDPAHFAASPVVVVIDGTDYVRSIQRAEPDGSLTFYCAIDEGLVLRVARGTGLVSNLEKTLQGLKEEIGPPQLLLTCDCILRNLEISQDGSKAAVEELLRQNNAVGFSTYGEQYGGVHVNQTLTGIAIGSDERQHGE
ncbi:MAG TPA: nitric oxide-sensing protein NosP [Aromatoleum sp.]|uniref:nitric oxide-sensing protein NosP n=1 Tax=Aromatoleum sp. TaxID=2307007 RepID=UPI002B480B2C|nr:nitric oxide-sensing protein NosP [Aromatoleum sp.]HJV26370.1 nitric oxide-sensing protein NosP [Aromatoleum sp.]